MILNTGKVDIQTLGKISDNIYAYSFVPQIEVLQHADVFLTHCGMNSVNEAMALGVPMVAMPFINDQLSNAKRIVELGIGKFVHFPVVESNYIMQLWKFYIVIWLRKEVGKLKIN